MSNIIEELLEGTVNLTENNQKSENSSNEINTGPSLEKIIDLVKASSDNKKLLTRVYKTLSASKAVDELKTVLDNKGINKDTFDGRNVQNEIISILLKGEQNEIQEFVEIIEKKEIPESGNIYSITSTVSSSKIRQIANLAGAKRSVTMGKGEILFPLLFNNVKLAKSKAGDFIIDNTVVELKDIDGRLGTGRTATKYTPINPDGINNTSLLDTIIQDFNKSGNKEEALKHIEGFIKNAYYGDSGNQDISLTERDLANVDNLQLKMYEQAVKGYAVTKDIGKFILFNSEKGNFKMYTPEELVQAIKDRKVKLTNIVRSSTIPQISSFS